MRTGLALLGGLALAGGAAYYYWKNYMVKPLSCYEYGTEAACEDAGCYWCGNYCSAEPCDSQHSCDGVCMYPGMTDCDSMGNLCVCNNQGYWQLQELNSFTCDQGYTFLKCFKSINGVTACIRTRGSDADQCDVEYFSYGCPCFIGDCDDFHYCDMRVSRCVETAFNLPVSADNSNWDNCFSTTPPYCSECCNEWDSSGYTCDFDLGHEYGASTLFGEITYEWTTPISGADTNIYGYLDGVGWSYLGHVGGIGEGPHQFQIYFSAQGISKLRFASCALAWVNVKPKSFYGYLTL